MGQRQENQTVLIFFFEENVVGLVYKSALCSGEDNLGQSMQTVPQMPAAIGVGPTWATTDNFVCRYVVTVFLVQTLGMEEGFVRVLTDVTHLGPSNLHFKILGALAVELKCSSKDLSIARLQEHWRNVNLQGAPRRGVRFLQHADADWFEDALEDFVNDLADRVPLKKPSGNAIP